MSQKKNWDAIVDAITALPEHSTRREAAVQALENIKTDLERKHKILNLVQQAIGQLRLDLKYLVFDLEATRRERDQYKERLGE